MASIVISGDTSGSVTLSAPSVAGSNTATLPASTGNVVLDTATQTLTNKTLTSPTINTPTMGGSVITSGTVQNSTTGTSIDFTGIPSWVKRITVIFNGVSVSGTSDMLIQTGTSGGVVTTGYSATAGRLGGGGTAYNTYTTGFPCVFNGTATYTYTGTIVITNITGNTWIALATTVPSNTAGQITIGSGSIALGSALDRVRLTTVNGTDTFDAGSVNILYE